ncbi:hypothetical protein [Flavobacterium panici]|uniref:Lipoprotein n=1 Tax=Flavobacterium panici TaxID=2654843 RepID=A0A9N8P250_9FLAO|nr:hypothetical protein [Flavobacterium panici]CAC9974703.1 hypothetical protein FLAPXU55_02400 [Flavobacterium panici]
MIKKILCLFLVSIAVISCKKESEAKHIKTSLGIVANFEGTDLFANNDLSQKTDHLNYAAKIEVISFDSKKGVSKILYKNQELYVASSALELLSKKENDNSYFTKDCYCLMGLKEAKTLNFPTKYDTVHYFEKDNKIRFIKEVSYYKPSYETYKSHDIEMTQEDYNADGPNFYSYVTIDRNNFLIGTFFTEQNKSYLECYNKKSTYEVSKNSSKLSEYYETEEFNYAMNLFNTDLLFAKIGNDNFVKSSDNFDYKKQAILIDQGELNLEKNVNIQLYSLNNFEPVVYNDHAILFNYLREFKIVKKEGKKRYFVKIYIEEFEGSDIAGEYYIDLKEIAAFASIGD